MRSRIAVVGVSALFPGSSDAGSFWSNILAGKDLITDVPPTHWLVEDYYDPNPSAPDKTYCKRGAFLSPVEFDALEFGIPPTTLQSTDTSQLLALVTAQKVLEDASVGQFSSIARDRISVILGVASGTELLGHMVSRLQRPIWQKGLRASGMDEKQVQAACNAISDQFVPWQESTFPGLLGNVVAGRIANRLDLGGTNCVVDAACASSLSAVSMAVNELHLGQSDLAIVGGVDTINDILMYMCFSKTPALSPTGDCRPFSAAADGTMMGEGLAMLALRRLEDAERDGDAIYAVLEGIGTSSDGKSKSVYAPVAAGQAKALRRAYEQAGYGPDTVELVEAHGTGTIAGDAAEFGGLLEVFDAQGRADRQWCALGSVKSQIGHTKAAAGAAGLFKAVMALHHRVLPPTIKIEKPNPKLDIETSPFYLNTKVRPWIANPQYPRRASVSAFGFGGSNFHLTLQEYTGPAPRPKRFLTSGVELYAISGETAQSVAESCRNLAEAVKSGIPLDCIAQNTRFHFDTQHPARLALVAATRESLLARIEKLETRLARLDETTSFEDPAGAYFHQGTSSPKVAFLFPGQGSQYIGMGRQLAVEFEQARQVWDHVAHLLPDEGGRLGQTTFPRPAFSEAATTEQDRLLTSTDWAQPAIGVTSLSYLDLLASLGLRPSCTAGHSFGELTALHAAGVIDRNDYLHAAFHRGRLMKAAARESGAMTAVTVSKKELEALIRNSGTNVVIANANEPRQTVASGQTFEIERLEAYLTKSNTDFKRLNVDTAFHSPLVTEASQGFLRSLQSVTFNATETAVYSNTEVLPYPVENVERCRALLAGQISRPVRFVEQIEAMYESGVRVFLEVGPGSTIANLVQKILKGRSHHAISLDRKGSETLTPFFQGMAKLSAAGVPLDFGGLFKGFRAPHLPAKKKPGVSFPISGVNYGKPYPGFGPGAPKPKSQAAANPEAINTVVPAVIHATQAKVEVPATDGVKRAPFAGSIPILPASLASPALRATASFTPSRTLNEQSPKAEALSTAGSPSSTPHQTSKSHMPQTPQAQRIPMNQMNGSAQNLNSNSLPVYLEIQRQTAEAHLVYQRAMAESHAAYLRTMEVFFAGLTGIPAPAAAGPADPLWPDVGIEPTQTQVAAAPLGSVPLAVPASVQAVSAPVVPQAVAPIQKQAAATVITPTVMAAPPLAAGRAVVSPAAPALPVTPASLAPTLQPTSAVTAPITPGLNSAELAALKARLLEVVADKTGYPADILDLKMDMEADLGIDSIKRVEILSAFREATPDMPEIKGKEMAGLRTLAEVVQYVETSVQPRGLL